MISSVSRPRRRRGMHQCAQQVLARVFSPSRDDRDEEQHQRHRRRADASISPGVGSSSSIRASSGLCTKELRALKADIEQLRDNGERDRVGELAHQLDRLAVGERCDRAVDDRGDALLDPPYRARGEEAVHRAPQPRVGGRVAHQQRPAPKLRDRAWPAQGSEQLRAVAWVRAPLGTAQHGRRVLVGEHEMGAELLVPLDGRPARARGRRGMGPRSGTARLSSQARPAPGVPRRTRGRACPSR